MDQAGASLERNGHEGGARLQSDQFHWRSAPLMRSVNFRVAPFVWVPERTPILAILRTSSEFLPSIKRNAKRVCIEGLITGKFIRVFKYLGKFRESFLRLAFSRIRNGKNVVSQLAFLAPKSVHRY